MTGAEILAKQEADAVADAEAVVKAEQAALDAVGATQVNIVTTAVGSFGPLGLAAVGSKAAVDVAAFSDTWMRPATIGDRNKLVKAGKIAK